MFLFDIRICTVCVDDNDDCSFYLNYAQN